MKKQVIWVDEDERIWAPERLILTALGFDVVAVGDASTALSLLQNQKPGDIALIILDVMLLPGDDEVTFSDDATQNGLNTGLVLAEKINEIDNTLPRRTILFSRATAPSHVNLIRRKADQLGTYYLPKGPDTQGHHFIRWLKDHGFVRSQGHV